MGTPIKGYLGGYYGTNAWNAKTGYNWQISATRRQLSRLGETQSKNIEDRRNYEMRLFNLFIQRFKWENLPCPEYYLEQSLLYNGMAVAFVDPDFGALLLPCTIESRNIYNEPIIVRAIGLDYNMAVSLGGDYTEGQGILLYDNPHFYPPYLQLQRTASILGDLNRTCEVYGYGLKSPLLLHADDDTVKSIKMTAQGVLDNEPYRALIVEREKSGKSEKKVPLLTTSAISQFNTPNKASELRGIFAHMVAYANDTLGIYGLDGVGGAGKLAQTSEDEVNAANAFAATQLQIALNLRKRFCKEMNKMKIGNNGKDITVRCNIEASSDTDKGDAGVGNRNKQDAQPTEKPIEDTIKS